MSAAHKDEPAVRPEADVAVLNDMLSHHPLPLAYKQALQRMLARASAPDAPAPQHEWDAVVKAMREMLLATPAPDAPAPDGDLRNRMWSAVNNYARCREVRGTTYGELRAATEAVDAAIDALLRRTP